MIWGRFLICILGFIKPFLFDNKTKAEKDVIIQTLLGHFVLKRCYIYFLLERRQKERDKIMADNKVGFLI